MDTTKQEKARGKCSGCAFSYQLSTARTGDHKGALVIRKHNSRIGPGLCTGVGLPPAVEKAQRDEAPVADGSDEPHHVALRRKDPSLPETDVHRGRQEDCRETNCRPFAETEVVDATGFVATERPVLECVEPKKHCRPGGCRGCCGCSAVCTKNPCGDPDGFFVHTAPVTVSEALDTVMLDPPEHAAHFADPEPIMVTVAATIPDLADPAPVMTTEREPVSGQPEPDRDRYGRYVISGQPHTRATTFAKLGSSTYALGEWNERMLIKGLVQRPDLLAMAHGLDVKRDRARLNQIADDAQTHAGNKVAANLGTALHGFSEQLDAGLIALDGVPEQWRPRLAQYQAQVTHYGLTTRGEWIERTTAVRADQVSAPLPVAGTLDRIFRLPNGELVIGDLKTGSDLSYGFVEIAVQLALYAHGVNTHGLFDWKTKTWQVLERPVRTDWAIVMHLPADGDGCTLYRVDLVKGWEYARVSGRVQSRQKDKSVASPLTELEVRSPVPVEKPALPPHMLKAAEVVTAAQSPGDLARVYEYALSSGRFSPGELVQLKDMCALRWQELQN